MIDPSDAPSNVQPDLRVGVDRRRASRGGRRDDDLERYILRNPEACPHPGCNGKTHVLSKRDVEDRGWIRRRHECSQCKRRWRSYQSLIDPKDVHPDVIDPSARKRYW
jgi:hypothetical protein